MGGRQPDEGDAESGIAVEDEVIAEPAHASSQQAVPEMLEQQIEGAAVKATGLQPRTIRYHCATIIRKVELDCKYSYQKLIRLLSSLLACTSGTQVKGSYRICIQWDYRINPSQIPAGGARNA